ncbi:type 1 periplasmic binding fold superfamily protein [Robertkochia flava]|uniref:type 1 periplasmic binding fold superfamily protein n=1 Tax=Robertkochia flava TaxID=3447986 RepID=UPI001CCA491B|nr:type 1 periplasmic binding fold superfamily protein [Robertkochia marina]
MKSFLKINLALVALIVLSACSSDDDTPEQINEEELIDRVVLEITDTDTQAMETFIWEEGATAPEPIVLNSGKTYAVEIGFFNASNPGNIIDITEEVIEEADEHQVFYETDISSLTISPAGGDFEDTQGNKLGILTNWSATGTTSGAVTTYLVHEPVSKTGTDRDDLGGETDVQVAFTVVIN